MTCIQPRERVSAEEFERRVRETAYHFWQERERRAQNQRLDLDDWFTAERRLKTELHRMPTHDEVAMCAAHLAERRRKLFEEQDWTKASQMVLLRASVA